MTDDDQWARECLFFHDTQMAILEREQRLLRAAFLRAAISPNSASSPNSLAGPTLTLPFLPFNLCLPFCPCPPDANLRGTLLVSAPRALSGWIVRPIQGSPDESAPRERVPAPNDLASPGDESALVPLPGYPPFPPGTNLILGFAGNLAERILAEAKPDDGPFTVQSRYWATLTLNFIRAENRVIGAKAVVGPAKWEKPKKTRTHSFR
jgi:hypothetical protein